MNKTCHNIIVDISIGIKKVCLYINTPRLYFSGRLSTVVIMFLWLKLLTLQGLIGSLNL